LRKIARASRGDYITTFCTTSQGPPEDHFDRRRESGAAGCARARLQRRRHRTGGVLIEQHLTMSVVAQSRDLSDRKTIENFARGSSIGRADEAADILTTAISGVRPRRLERLKAQLLPRCITRPNRC